MNDVSYDLFYNSAAKVLGNKPVFTPEELASKRNEILNFISQSDHPENIKQKANIHLNNSIRIREKIKKNLSGFKQLSQPGTKDSSMFNEEKFLVGITSKINRIFGPANYKLYNAKDYNQKYSLIIDLTNNIKKEIESSLSNIKEFQKLDKFKTILENIYNKKISNLKSKYLNIADSNKSNDNVVSGLTTVPNLIGLDPYSADGALLESGLKTEIKHIKSAKAINTIVNQSPKSGEIKSKGSSVVIYVSSGQ